MRTLAFAALLFTVSNIQAAGTSGKPLAIAAITAQQAQIRSDVLAGEGRYRDMPTRTRNELLDRQTRLLRMLDGKISSDDLSQDQRMEAFNTLEWIEAAINNAEDERMICKREKTLGSNMDKRVCKTVAQRREEQEAARRSIDRGCAGGVCTER